MLRFGFLERVKTEKNMNLIASSFTSVSLGFSSLFYVLSSARLSETNVRFIALFCAVFSPFILFSFCSQFFFTSSLYVLFSSSSHYHSTFLLFISLFSTHSSSPSSASFAFVPFLFLVSISFLPQPLLYLLPFF